MALAGVIGTLGAIGMAKSHFRGKGALETLSTLPMMIPEIILGMAYLVIFSAVGIPLGMPTLVVTHMTFCVPYVYINVSSRLVGMDPSVEEAARDLGAGPWRVLLDITLPLVAPAVASGMLLALAMSLDDVIISSSSPRDDHHAAAEGLYGPAQRRHAGDQRAVHAAAGRGVRARLPGAAVAGAPAPPPGARPRTGQPKSARSGLMIQKTSERGEPQP